MPPKRARARASGKSSRMTASPKGRAELSAALSKAIKASLLPGDTPFAGEQLAVATDYLLETAIERKSGEADIDLHSASAEHRLLNIAIVNDDMPFLVDSVAGTIAAQGLAIDRLVHPVLAAGRTEPGTMPGTRNNARNPDS